MNPSQKYMPNITDEDDIKLVPFNTNRQTPSNENAPFTMSTTGWIPVYFLNNPPFNSIGPSMGNMMPNMSSGMGNMMPNMSSGMGNMSPLMGDNMTSPITMNGSEGLPNLPNMNTTNSTLSKEDFYTYTPYNPLMNQSNRELPNIIELLSNFDLDLDEDIDLARNCADKSIDKVYEKIEKNHPEIFALVRAYNIPCPIFKLLIRRIIKLSINYQKREGE